MIVAEFSAKTTEIKHLSLGVLLLNLKKFLPIV